MNCIAKHKNYAKFEGVYTVYELIQMIKDWNERPFDEYTTTVPKQQIKFPSVTVCPSGKKLLYYLS